ncbi:hypothetical protein HaLaN_10595, partial [Haematococcus lacustris]
MKRGIKERFGEEVLAKVEKLGQDAEAFSR